MGLPLTGVAYAVVGQRAMGRVSRPLSRSRSAASAPQAKGEAIARGSSALSLMGWEALLYGLSATRGLDVSGDVVPGRVPALRPVKSVLCSLAVDRAALCIVPYAPHTRA